MVGSLLRPSINAKVSKATAEEDMENEIEGWVVKSFVKNEGGEKMNVDEGGINGCDGGCSDGPRVTDAGNSSAHFAALPTSSRVMLEKQTRTPLVDNDGVSEFGSLSPARNGLLIVTPASQQRGGEDIRTPMTSSTAFFVSARKRFPKYVDDGVGNEEDDGDRRVRENQDERDVADPKRSRPVNLLFPSSLGESVRERVLSELDNGLENQYECCTEKEWGKGCRSNTSTARAQQGQNQRHAPKAVDDQDEHKRDLEQSPPQTTLRIDVANDPNEPEKFVVVTIVGTRRPHVKRAAEIVRGYADWSAAKRKLRRILYDANSWEVEVVVDVSARTPKGEVPSLGLVLANGREDYFGNTGDHDGVGARGKEEGERGGEETRHTWNLGGVWIQSVEHGSVIESALGKACLSNGAVILTVNGRPVREGLDVKKQWDTAVRRLRESGVTRAIGTGGLGSYSNTTVRMLFCVDRHSDLSSVDTHKLAVGFPRRRGECGFGANEGIGDKIVRTDVLDDKRDINEGNRNMSRLPSAKNDGHSGGLRVCVQDVDGRCDTKEMEWKQFIGEEHNLGNSCKRIREEGLVVEEGDTIKRQRNHYWGSNDPVTLGRRTTLCTPMVPMTSGCAAPPPHSSSFNAMETQADWRATKPHIQTPAAVFQNGIGLRQPGVAAAMPQQMAIASEGATNTIVSTTGDEATPVPLNFISNNDDGETESLSSSLPLPSSGMRIINPDENDKQVATVSTGAGGERRKDYDVECSKKGKLGQRSNCIEQMTDEKSSLALAGSSVHSHYEVVPAVSVASVDEEKAAAATVRKGGPECISGSTANRKLIDTEIGGEMLLSSEKWKDEVESKVNPNDGVIKCGGTRMTYVAMSNEKKDGGEEKEVVEEQQQGGEDHDRYQRCPQDSEGGDNEGQTENNEEQRGKEEGKKVSEGGEKDEEGGEKDEEQKDKEGREKDEEQKDEEQKDKENKEKDEEGRETGEKEKEDEQKDKEGREKDEEQKGKTGGKEKQERREQEQKGDEQQRPYEHGNMLHQQPEENEMDLELVEEKRKVDRQQKCPTTGEGKGKDDVHRGLQNNEGKELQRSLEDKNETEKGRQQSLEVMDQRKCSQGQEEPRQSSKESKEHSWNEKGRCEEQSRIRSDHEETGKAVGKSTSSPSTSDPTSYFAERTAVSVVSSTAEDGTMLSHVKGVKVEDETSCSLDDDTLSEAMATTEIHKTEGTDGEDRVTNLSSTLPVAQPSISAATTANSGESAVSALLAGCNRGDEVREAAVGQQQQQLQNKWSSTDDPNHYRYRYDRSRPCSPHSAIARQSEMLAAMPHNRNACVSVSETESTAAAAAFAAARAAIQGCSQQDGEDGNGGNYEEKCKESGDVAHQGDVEGRMNLEQRADDDAETNVTGIVVKTETGTEAKVSTSSTTLKPAGATMIHGVTATALSCGTPGSANVDSASPRGNSLPKTVAAAAGTGTTATPAQTVRGSNAAPVRRKRGRPRKFPLPSETAEMATSAATANAGEPHEPCKDQGGGDGVLGGGSENGSTTNVGSALYPGIGDRPTGGHGSNLHPPYGGPQPPRMLPPPPNTMPPHMTATPHHLSHQPQPPHPAMMYHPSQQHSWGGDYSAYERGKGGGVGWVESSPSSGSSWPPVPTQRGGPLNHAGAAMANHFGHGGGGRGGTAGGYGNSGVSNTPNPRHPSQQSPYVYHPPPFPAPGRGGPPPVGGSIPVAPQARNFPPPPPYGHVHGHGPEQQYYPHHPHHQPYPHLAHGHPHGHPSSPRHHPPPVVAGSGHMGSGNGSGNDHNENILSSESSALISSSSSSSGSGLSSRSAARSSRRCTCKKSKCLKLYCECFASSSFCDPNSCCCRDCRNSAQFQDLRDSAWNKVMKKRKTLMESTGGIKMGCNCKKSFCLKKYCECFLAKSYCSSTCRCKDCQNYKGSPSLKKSLIFSSKATSGVVGGATVASGSVAVFGSGQNYGGGTFSAADSGVQSSAAAASVTVNTTAPAPAPCASNSEPCSAVV